MAHLAGINDKQRQELADQGLHTEADIVLLSADELKEVCPSLTVVQRKKLMAVGKYAAAGNPVNKDTTMSEVSRFLVRYEAGIVDEDGKKKESTSEDERPQKKRKAETHDIKDEPVDITKGAPKVNLNAVSKYDGEPKGWDTWEKQTMATLGQTVYSELLRTAPTQSNPATMCRNRELYNMLWSATLEGHASMLVEKHKEDGHAAWQEMQSFYGSNEASDTVTEDAHNQLSNLKLDENRTATDYIAKFIKYNRKLEERNEGYPEKRKKTMFLNQILDDDYQSTRELLKLQIGNHTFEDLVFAIRRREQDIDLQDMTEQNKRARRGRQEDDGNTRSDNNEAIPRFPQFMMNMLNKKQNKRMKAALMKWRYTFNKEGRHITRAEFVEQYGDDDDRDGSKGNRKGGQEDNRGRSGNNKEGKSKRKGDKKVRRTKTSSAGTKHGVRVEMKDHHDHDSNSSSDDSDDERSSGGEGAKRSRRNPLALSITRRGRQPYARVVIDPGTDFEVIGGVGWRVVERFNRDTSMSGAFAGSHGASYPVVSAVTIFDSSTGPILIGIGAAAWDDRAEQNESLLNSHEMRKYGIDVDDKSERDGGTQQLTIGSHRIPLVFENERTLHFRIREPTEDEMNNLEIQWLIPKCQTATSSLLRRRNKVVIRPEPAPWRERLGFPPEAVVAATMAATTQLCADPVEMENREAPRQHRKSRVLPLHPRRIEGRTDSDTYFSSVKSVRGFICVQVFVSLLAQYIFVRCLRRERHSHNAYQDLIRYVGAPNILLTDNARTETGKKWTKTSRDNQTRQIFTAPHNQQQNHAERKIQDIKKRTILVLRYGNAPLEFWCYCLEYVVACFNYTSHATINNRTPHERMFGHTPDISCFRFRFWEPVWYYEPTAKHPKPNFLPGRFVGIAWDHGDAFTYRVWTTPADDWTKGLELIRNIVKSRALDQSEPFADYTDDELAFEKERPSKTHSASKKQSTRTRDGKHGAAKPAAKPAPSKRRKVEFSSVQSPTVTTDMAIPGERETEQHQPNTTPTNQNDTNPHSDGANNNVDEVDDVDDVGTRTDLTTMEFDPIEDSRPIEMVDEINNEIEEEPETVSTEAPVAIKGHRWKDGELRLKVKWPTEELSYERIRDAKLDYPLMTAKYIVANKVSRGGRDRIHSWATKTIRDIKRSARRLQRLYSLDVNNHNDVKLVRRAKSGVKKKKQIDYSKPVYSYGVQVPRTVKQALELDAKNNDDSWQQAIEKEVKTLTDVDCFVFKPKGYKPEGDWQQTRLHMVFAVKHDLRRKARLVAGGHLVELREQAVYSSTVKPISVKLLHVIAHKQGLKVLCGDVGNAYVNAYTNERVYATAGPEFGKHEGKTVIIQKALYGLVSSSERWHAHFADTLRGLGFRPTRYDNDVWIKDGDDGKTYDYLCTHVDDFMIVSKKPEVIMKALEDTYNIKGKGPPDYYLGNDYKQIKGNRWAIGCKRYLKEAIGRIESIFGPLPKRNVPLPGNDHPEEDDTEILSDDKHRKYQMLIGMLNWVVAVGRFDVAHATASMSRFSSCPRQGHLDRVLQIFSYLKRRINRRFITDSRDPLYFGNVDCMDEDLSEELQKAYPEASEEVDSNVPDPRVDEMKISVFVDSDHAHDKVTRRSMTGMIIFVGRTPVFYLSKRQGAIETSTYGAEFCAMKQATEEAISVRYMLRCLGVSVTTPTQVFGDNNGVVQNATLKDSLLKKKHTAINYHRVREATAAGIIQPVWIKSSDNFADLMTKSLPNKPFNILVGRSMS